MFYLKFYILIMNKYLFQRAGCIFSKNLIQKFSIMLNKMLKSGNKFQLNTIPYSRVFRCGPIWPGNSAQKHLLIDFKLYFGSIYFYRHSIIFILNKMSIDNVCRSHFLFRWKTHSKPSILIFAKGTPSTQLNKALELICDFIHLKYDLNKINELTWNKFKFVVQSIDYCVCYWSQKSENIKMFFEIKNIILQLNSFIFIVIKLSQISFEELHISYFFKLYIVFSVCIVCR